MRVLHVIAGIAPRYGGPSQAVGAMSRALRGRGVESWIATTDADGRGRLPVAHGVPSLVDGATVVYFPRQWSEAFKLSLPLARWLDVHVAEFDVVEVHGVFSHSSLAAARACRRAGVPYVIRPLGALARWSLAQKPWRKRILWRFGIGRMLSAAAAIHYTSEAERQQAEERLRLPRGVVIPLPVAGPSDDVGFPPWDRRPYVLALGRLHPKKCLDVLIEAFSVATRGMTGAEWHLVLAGVGDESYVERLRAIARDRGVAERVLFPGWLSPPQRDAALAHAALATLVSRQENFGLAAVEALAAGLPVVVSPEVDLAEELLAAGAAWVARPDADALADVLREALADPRSRRERGQAGRELVRRSFSDASVGGALLAFYRSLAEITPRRPH